MLKLENERQKIIVLLVMLGVSLAAILASYIVSRNSLDQRGRASTNQGPVDVMFAPHTNYTTGVLPSVGSVFNVDVKMQIPTTSNVTGGAITISYPTSVLTVDRTKTMAQARNTTEACNVLDQTISVTIDETAGLIKMVKATYVADSALPKGLFCYGTVFFTVKNANPTTISELKFSGNVASTVDWDIVGKAGRFTPRLGQPIRFGPKTTSIPISTITGTSKPSTTPASTLTANVNFPANTVSVGNVGSTLTVHVSMTSVNPVVGANFTMSYPTTILEFNRAMTESIAKTSAGNCNGLDQVLDIENIGNIVKIAKLSYKPEATLPKGTFCLAQVVFNVKTTSIPAGTKLTFAGNLNDVKDWDLVSTKGRLQPSYGVGAALVKSELTPVTGCPRKPEGDANCDNKVNLNDFERFREEYIKFRRGQLAIGAATSDFNTDGTVDIEDFAIFRETFITEAV